MGYFKTLTHLVILATFAVYGTACSQKKSKKNSPAATTVVPVETSESRSSIPPLAYQSTPPASTPAPSTSSLLGNLPGLLGGLLPNSNGGNFDLASILDLMKTFFGDNLPFNFLSETYTTNGQAQVNYGVSVFADSYCQYGIVTIPGGQADLYYQQLCSAFPNNTVSSIAINGQCMSLKSAASYSSVCNSIAKAKTNH